MEFHVAPRNFMWRHVVPRGSTWFHVVHLETVGECKVLEPADKIENVVLADGWTLDSFLKPTPNHQH